jgi:hypothetical protein
VIPPDELDKFHSDLADTLRRYRRMTAQSIGCASLQRFSDELDTKREIYEVALSSDDAKALSSAKRDAVISLTSSIEVLAALLRDLAQLVQLYSQPTRPGELSGSKDDLTALREGLTEVKEAIGNLMEYIDQAKKALLRGARRALKSAPRGSGDRSYHCEPFLAVAEHRH